MQSNDFQRLNGFIAKLTQAATKGMKRDNSFRKMQLQPGVEMKENTGVAVSFETNRRKTTNND